MAKVSCILRHWCVQLILAYSWARPAILVAGKGRGESFYSVSSLSLSFISSTLYTPDIRSMMGYIVFAFPFVRSSVHSFVRTFVCSFVCSFVRSFVFPSQGRSFCVKVYKTSYFEDPLMDFVHIWHDGRYRSKVFISTIPTPG